MIKQRHTFTLLAAVLLTSPAVLQADMHVELIDHPGAAETQVFGVNDRGHVVGNGLADPSLPFVFSSRTGTFTDIAPAAGFANTSVLGIDDAGNLVGSAVSLDETTVSGFTLSKQGVYTFFDHPAAFSGTFPRAVNNKGLVSGFTDRPDGSTLAFIYDPKTDTFTDIDNGASIFTISHGINNKGEVVGNSFFLPEDNPCTDTAVNLMNYGWVRSTDGTVTYFQVNGASTRPRGINDSGKIVGFVTVPGTGLTKGFTVEPDGTPCETISVPESDLLQVGDFEATFPEGISNSGVIVGIASTDTSHGFIARPR